MEIEPEPELIESPLSRSLEWNGVRLEVQIYRLATERGWRLEVVNELGISIVWDERFAADRDAHSAFRDTLASEGIEAVLNLDSQLFSSQPRRTAAHAGCLRYVWPELACKLSCPVAFDDAARRLGSKPAYHRRWVAVEVSGRHVTLTALGSQARGIGGGGCYGSDDEPGTHRGRR